MYMVIALYDITFIPMISTKFLPMVTKTVATPMMKQIQSHGKKKQNLRKNVNIRQTSTTPTMMVKQSLPRHLPLLHEAPEQNQVKI
jgi:hypothetical protein